MKIEIATAMNYQEKSDDNFLNVSEQEKLDYFFVYLSFNIAMS